MTKKPHQSVSSRMAGKKLGSLWQCNKRKGLYRLRRLPIKKNQKEKRIKYLLHTVTNEIITEIPPGERWQLVADHHDPKKKD